MITIFISTDPTTGADIAGCGIHVARSAKSCAARKLARALVGSGMPDQKLEARGLYDQKLRYTIRSLHAFARKFVAETSGAPTLAWWQEHPRQQTAYGAHRASEVARGIGLPKKAREALAASPLVPTGVPGKPSA